MRSTAASLAVALAAALSGSACSSSGSSATADAARAGFVVKAEAICAKANTDLAALHSPKASAEIPDYVHQVTTLAANTVRQLAALPLPPNDAAKLHARFLDPLLRQSDAGIRFDLQVKAAGGDQQKLLTLLAQAPTKTVADLAYLRAYGFHACVKAANTGH